ncbi:hypothetical protein GC167_10395 [bacterium]|nr:hypothetical protein [bacterium]
MYRFLSGITLGIYGLCSVFNPVHAQETAVERPHIVRWNLTPFLVSGPDSWVFGYERILKPQQSVSLNVGTMSLPLPESDQATGTGFRLVENRGWSAFADYRFYLGNLNRFPAPRGAYLAPYMGYFRFDSDAIIDFETSSGIEQIGVEAGIDVANLGVQFGYQFQFYEHFTLDLVLFGPSLSFYSIDMQASGQLSEEITEDEAYQAFVEKAIEIFPASEEFFNTGSLSKGGLNTAWGPGFRYLVQIGYRF